MEIINISRIPASIKTDKEGNETGIYKFDSNGANKALDMLMKHTGGYETDNKQKSFNISVNREAVEVEGNSI